MKIKITAWLLALVTIVAFTSCGDDDGDTDLNPDLNPSNADFLASEILALGEVDLGLTIPTTYPETNATTGTLAPAAYNGQVTRIEQLKQITAVLKDQPITADLSNALADGGNALFTGSIAGSGTNIRTKIDELNFDGDNGAVDQSVADAFANLADLMVQLSVDNNTAGNVAAVAGTAGVLDGRHFDANGLEYAQMLEKGLYGPLLYNQMAADYLRSVQAGSESTNNVADAGDDFASEGTARQHAFDEAFGYLGANPLTYPNSANASNGDGSFISNYMFDFSTLTEEAYGINLAQKTMDAFLFGRTVLKAGEGNTSLDESTVEEYYNAARADVILYVESALAAASFHYLNLSLEEDINLVPEDKLHHLSEALAFMYALAWGPQGETRISTAEVYDALGELGWGASNLSGVYDINLWDVTDAQLEAARQALNASFPGFADVDF
ncbi:MAG: DUF4856 domain-containing protein [Bacteroidota bacterium]